MNDLMLPFFHTISHCVPECSNNSYSNSFVGSSTYNLGCDTWTRAGQSCFMFYQGPLSSWQDARQKCQSIKGDLINVKDPDLQVLYSNLKILQLLENPPRPAGPQMSPTSIFSFDLYVKSKTLLADGGILSS